MPAMSIDYGEYRDIAYVRKEVELLAKQFFLQDVADTMGFVVARLISKLQEGKE